MSSEKLDKGEKMVEIATQNTKRTTELRQDAKKVIDELINTQTQIVNKNDGRVAKISNEGRNKMLSGEALRQTRENGFSKEAHFAACEKIQELFENAVHYYDEPPRHQTSDIKTYPKYISKILVNGKKAQAYLTLKELVEHGNRIYSLELQELRPLP